MRLLPYTRRASVNEIVPEEYQQKLMEVDFTMSKCFWLIGDITDDLINSVDRRRARDIGTVVTQNDIFEAVGFFCHRTIRTIRSYWEVAHYFPLEIRQKYDIPFVMFVEARWLKDWELFLSISDSNPMWSADRVKAEYYKSRNLPVPSPHIEDENLPVLVEQEKRADGKGNALLCKLEHAVDDLRVVLKKMELPVDLMSRIGDVILEIEDISSEIRRDVL